MALQDLDPLLFTQDNSCLGAAQQFIARKADDIHTCLDAVHDGGLVVDAQRLQIKETTRAQILDDRQAGLFAQFHQFLQGNTFGKAHDAEVGGMHLQQGTGILADGSFVVPQVGFVGGAHLPERAAALLHNFGDAERAADLHQFSTGGDDLAPLAQCA